MLINNGIALSVVVSVEYEFFILSLSKVKRTYINPNKHFSIIKKPENRRKQGKESW